MNALEHKIPPPIVVMLIGIAMWPASWLFPSIQMDSSLRTAMAGSLSLSGLGLTVVGVLTFGRAGTTIDPVNLEAASSFVTTGPFRYTRNPMYVGFTILLVGWAVYLSAWWAFLGPIVFVLYTTRFQIIPEERVLQSKFGTDYDEYRRKVRRWL